MTPLAIECRGLTRHYEDVRAVDGLDLAVRPGECFGLLGPNGAGKTTTIEILEGLNRPDSGEVTVLGRRWGTDERELRERLGISLPESRFHDKLTVFETLRLFRSFYRDGRDPEETMRDLSLEEKRDARVGKPPEAAPRLAVACALTGKPEIPSDEPTTGLDPQSRRQLWGLSGLPGGGGRSDDPLHGRGRALRPRARGTADHARERRGAIRTAARRILEFSWTPGPPLLIAAIRAASP